MPEQEALSMEEIKYTKYKGKYIKDMSRHELMIALHNLANIYKNNLLAKGVTISSKLQDEK